MRVHAESEMGQAVDVATGDQMRVLDSAYDLLRPARDAGQGLDAEALDSILTRAEGSATKPTGNANRISVTHSAYKNSAAGDLEVPLAGGLEVGGHYERLTLVQDTYRAFEYQLSPTVREYWGGTVRLSVTFTGGDLSVGFSLPLIAAKVDANQMRAAYRFEVLGLKDVAPIAAHLPKIGEFSPEAYVALLRSTEECAKLLLESELDPVRLFVESDYPGAEGAARTYLMALKWIASGNGTDRPDGVDLDSNEWDFSDWVNLAVHEQARREADPKAWAERKYRAIISMFPSI